MHTIWQDIGYGIRTLRKNLSFTVVAVIALALGIGANTAIFSIVNVVLLRPLPYRDAERIVAIQELGKDGTRIQVTPANFLDWRSQNTVFENLAAIFTRTANLAGTDEAERISLAVVSANFFDVFKVQPLQGRLFISEDEQAGHPAIVVLSHSLWQRRYGGEADIIGKAVTLDGRSYTVAGVAPAGFQYPDKTEAWLPPVRLAPAPNETMDVTRVRGFGFLSAVARLKDGVSLEQAKQEMETITARLREQYPETNNNRFNRVVTLHTHLVGDTSSILLLLLGAVCFVLLIACANVANLLLARSASRQKEMAIRAALGASRWRIIRQLLTESVMLALLGGVLGLLLAWWGIDMMTRLLPADFPRLQDIHLDWYVLLFTFALSLLTGVIFGFAPAWQISKSDVQESLKESSRGTAGSRRRNRLRSILVVAEVAMSLILLIGAGLLFRSFLRLQAVNTGFNSEQVLTMRLTPSGTNFRQDEQYIAFYNQVAERLSAIPGVESVGMINTLPLSKGPTAGFRVEGRPLLPPDQWPDANYRNINPDYFRTMGIPILQGRTFARGDTASAPLRIIINQATADRDFAGENPVGKRINFGNVDSNNQPVWFEIIGVVANTRSLELNTEPAPEIYTAASQDAFGSMAYVIRTTIEPTALTSAVREAAKEVDQAQPISDVRTMDNIVSGEITQPRFNLTLLGIFSGIALLLSATGIYGVTSYGVAQRTHEIGIRMALGAQFRDVLQMILGQGMRLASLGIGIGLLGSFLLTRLLTNLPTQLQSKLLFGVGVTDPMTFALVSLFFMLVAMVACFVPARRAAKTDPMVALHYE